jgi:DNA-directed RNA polymerase subunit RPC12/RpoP
VLSAEQSSNERRPMPVYTCPECGAQLRPANAVPAGKKLRCPKCDNVFAPAGKAAAKAPPIVEAIAEEEDRYGFAQEEESHNQDATRAAFDPIKNRFKLSARGPALILVVKPSTALLATGCLTCIMAIALAMFAVWPMIFKIEDVQPPDKMAKFRGPQSTERRFKELTEDERQEAWLMVGGSVFQFLWGAVICAGSSKMHTLENYPLAMIGSVMAFIGPFVPLGIWLLNYALKNSDTMWVLPSVLMLGGTIPICFWCVATLRNKKVIAGFQEEKPEEF